MIINVFVVERTFILVTEDLIVRIRQGDREAFRSVVEQYTGFALSLAFRLTSDRDEAADIVQESWIRIWEKRKTLRPVETLKPWITRIVVNRCYDHLRRIRRRGGKSERINETVMDKLISEYDSETDLNLKEAGHILEILTNDLSPKQKIVFTLIELQDLNHDEVAGITGLSKSSVKSNLSYAKRKLKEKMAKYIHQEL